MEPETPLASPKLETLRQEVAAGNAAALERFWQELSRQGAPLIEPIPGDDSHSLVTFVWRAPQEIQSVAVVSNLNGQLGASEALTHLPGTDLWYKTYRLPNDTRESYQFAVAGANLTDPLNARQHSFPDDPEVGLTGWVSSVLELPAAPPQTWIAPRAGVPRGQVTLHRIRHDGLDQEYRMWVYTPPGYRPDGAPYGCGCSEAGIAHLLDVLAGVQVLTRQAGRYALTSSAATFLVRGRPAYAGDLMLAWTGPAIWESAGRAVRSGQPAPFEEYHEQDAWLESYSEWRIASSLEMWQAAGIGPQPDRPRLPGTSSVLFIALEAYYHDVKSFPVEF